MADQATSIDSAAQSTATTETTRSFKKPQPGAFCYTVIPATDMDRAQKFYKNVFDWHFREESAASDTLRIFMTGGDVMGALHRVDSLRDEALDVEEIEARNGLGVRTNYVLVEDVEEALKKVEAAGGMIVKGKWNVGGHTDLGLYKDTEGNVSGVLKWFM